MKKIIMALVTFSIISASGCSSIKESTSLGGDQSLPLNKECQSSDGKCQNQNLSPYSNPDNNIPSGAIRQELINLTTEKKVDYTIIGTTNGSHCGWSVLPLFPVLPSHIIEYSPSIISMNASAEAAYMIAIKKNGADFLLDTKVSKKSVNLLLASYTCFNVTGLGAKISR